MSTDSVNLAGLGGTPSQNIGQPKPPIARARVVTAPASTADSMVVALEGYSLAWPTEIHVGHWQEKGTSLPQRGDVGVVIFDGIDSWLVGWASN